MRVGYARLSTRGQTGSLDRQERAQQLEAVTDQLEKTRPLGNAVLYADGGEAIKEWCARAEH